MSRELQDLSLMIDVCFDQAEQIEQEETIWDQILVLFIWCPFTLPFIKPRGRAIAILRLNLAFTNIQLNFAAHGQKNCIY